MKLEQLARVHAIVRTIVPRHYDTEQVAVDVLTESWLNHIDNPTYQFIRNRCIDYLRHEKVEQRVLRDQRPPTSVGPQTTVETNQLVNALLSVLTNDERKAIYYRFNCDYTIAETASRMRLDPKLVRELLEVALYKMKQEVQHD